MNIRTIRKPKNQPYIYTRPDGTIEVRYTPPGGKRKTRIARDISHANQLLGQIAAPTVPRPPTLAAWAATWLRLRLAEGLDHHTAATVYRPALDRVTARLGSTTLSALTPALLADLWVTLATTPTPTGKRGYAPTTIRTTRRVLRLCLASAHEHDLIAKNPASTRPPRVAARDVEVSVERAMAILRATKGTRVEGMALLGLCYGMRTGEVLGLRWTDIDRIAGLLTVQGQCLPDGTYRARTKSGKKRELPLLATVAVVLGEQANPHNPYVFPGRGRQPRSRPGVRHAFLKALRDASLPPMRFHDLRHMTTTLLARLGVDEPVRQEIVGHSSAQVHGLYRHISRDDKEAALRRLSALIGGG